MISLADAVKAGIITRDLTDDETWAVEDVLNAAAEWQAGRMPLAIFATIGAVPAWNSHGRRCDSTGWGRCLALLSTPQTDPRWHALNAVLEALIRLQNVVVTKQGIFERSDLYAAGVTVK